MEKFNAGQFISTEWDSSEQKAKFANQFIKFVINGFQRRHFPKWFYCRLMNTFGHIAHFNQQGFWETFFVTKRRTLQFLGLTLNHFCYGDPKYTYSDVEQAIQGVLRSIGIFEKQQIKVEQDIRTCELIQLAYLKNKYEKGSKNGQKKGNYNRS